jgi:exopolysaccharide biosynthesis polyprenyl glycosylphosphotransferase
MLALSLATRETDIRGWCKRNETLGVVFTEISGEEKGLIGRAILSRITTVLTRTLDSDQVNEIGISLNFFPEDWDMRNPGNPVNHELYPELFRNTVATRRARFLKRTMDVVGSIFALIVFSPLFALFAILIKLTSKGTILFRQKRVGRYGTTFECLKFRSMNAGNDASIHKEYVEEFIGGREDLAPPGQNGNPIYKIRKDPRVTAVGEILRKSSLDELPQLWNVLKGEMSLVGPRPPIPYELELYDIWHRRRVLEAKPGITGLWQVNGRSKTTFDEMVRLDLKYAKIWSPWLDVKILLKTPWAVLSGEGAY